MWFDGLLLESRSYGRTCGPAGGPNIAFRITIPAGLSLCFDSTIRKILARPPHLGPTWPPLLPSPLISPIRAKPNICGFLLSYLLRFWTYPKESAFWGSGVEASVIGQKRGSPTSSLLNGGKLVFSSSPPFVSGWRANVPSFL